MNKLFFIVLSTAALLLSSCHSSTVKISGRFVGSETKNLYLEQVSTLKQSIIDTATLSDDGSYHFELKNVAPTPSLYNLVCEGERIPLLLAGGDRVDVSSMGSVLRNYTVSGSEESELLRSFYQDFVGGARKLDDIAEKVNANLSKEERDQFIRAYSDEYYRIRQAQLKFIIEHKANLAAIYALYQRLPGDTHLFSDDSDVVYFRTVAEAVKENYPESQYLLSLESEIARMEARISLTEKITEAGYPDLEMSNIYGKKIRLSSLTGKVVLLDFWTAEAGNSNVLNAELKEIYKQYSKANTPFEVYQVSLDTSKAAWITAVQEQQLPWISVSDLRGRASTAVGFYNVQRLPSNYLIDKNGSIVAKDIYGDQLKQKLSELTL